jgi:hypothetical protein
MVTVHATGVGVGVGVGVEDLTGISVDETDAGPDQIPADGRCDPRELNTAGSDAVHAAITSTVAPLSAPKRNLTQHF